jgi:hypothetical protein
LPAKQALFYSSKDDLHNGLKRLEEHCEVSYIRTGLFDAPQLERYSSYKEIENIGISLDGRIESLPTYLIVESDEVVVPKEIPQRRGGVRYSLNSRVFPSSVTFTPSGSFEEKCIIYGTLSGLEATNAKSIMLYKAFEKHVLKGFKKIKSFKVSPQALVGMDSGIRMTCNINAHQSMDLAK